MNPKEKYSVHFIGKLAGICFLVIVIGYTLNWTFLYSKVISPGNDLVTISNIITNQLLIRLGIVSDLIIAIFSILLAWSLYILLKKTNGYISLIALILRLLDPFLVIITVSIGYIFLQLVNTIDYSVYFSSIQIQPIIGLFFNLHTSTTTIPMVFTSIGFLTFFSVLIKTKIVPKALTIFGIISYALLLLVGIIKILGISDSSSILGKTELLLYLPSVLFEIIIGLYLCISNINIGDEKD
jgi:hypothetical protein